MKQAPAWTPRLERIGYPGVLSVLTFCTLLISGGFMMTVWRMMDLQHQQNQHHRRTLREIQVFHKYALDDLRKLVDQSAVQATEDLCQVRFRMRDEDGWGIPIGKFVLNLYRIRNNQSEKLSRLETGVDQGPIADFGLVPPGDYRLTIANSLGMICHHDFRVLPGVPVDRAILCPFRPSWTYRQDTVPLPLEIPWPVEWKSLPLVVVYHLEANRKILGRWEWLPPAKRQFRRWVVRGKLAGPLSEDRLCQALPKTLFAHPLLPSIEGPDVGTIQVPYSFCQVTAISFLLDPSEEKPPVYLGSFGFAGEEGSLTSPPDFEADNLTLLPYARPCWEYHEDQVTPWEIRLPHQMIRHVRARAESELRNGQSAAL